jgi:hypothetical protein
VAALVLQHCVVVAVKATPSSFALSDSQISYSYLSVFLRVIEAPLAFALQ